MKSYNSHTKQKRLFPQRIIYIKQTKYIIYIYSISFLLNYQGTNKSSITLSSASFADQVHTNLTNWGWMTHICIDNQTTIGSDIGLSPGWCQAIIWTNAGKMLIGILPTHFCKILIKIHTFSFKMKMLSAKWLPFCLSLNMLGSWGPSQ